MENDALRPPHTTDTVDNDPLLLSKSVNATDSTDLDFPKIRLYKRRWFMLFIYSINSMSNAALFSTIVSINDIAGKYYNVRPSVIDWLPNSFLLIYVLVALPSAYLLSSFGLRIAMLLGSSLNVIAACLHFAGYQRHGFIYVIVGQIIAGLSVGAILQIPARLSTVWFAEKEHARATSIGIFCNIFGVATGFVQPSNMVPQSNNMDEVGKGMFNLYLSQMVFLFICLLLVYVFFEDHPPLPPSFAASLSMIAAEENQQPFLESIKTLTSDINFNLLTQAYGLYFGMFSFFIIVLNEMVALKVTEAQIGWMGFSTDCFGILGIILSGFFIDKYKCYQLMSMILIFGSLVSWVAFTFILMRTNSQTGLFIAYSFVGFFGIPFFSSGIEQAAEMTYPISEGTSSAVVLIFGNLYGFVLVLFLGAWVDQGKIVVVCYITTGVYALAFIFICVTRTKMKRQEAEHQQQNVLAGLGDDSMQQVA